MGAFSLSHWLSRIMPLATGLANSLSSFTGTELSESASTTGDCFTVRNFLFWKSWDQCEDLITPRALSPLLDVGEVTLPSLITCCVSVFGLTLSDFTLSYSKLRTEASLDIVRDWSITMFSIFLTVMACSWKWCLCKISGTRQPSRPHFWLELCRVNTKKALRTSCRIVHST